VLQVNVTLYSTDREHTSLLYCLCSQLRTCLEEVFRADGHHRAANTIQQLSAHNAATSRVDLREGCFSFSEAQIKDATVIVSIVTHCNSDSIMHSSVRTFSI
jgi:hypothetical protein